MNLQKVPPKLKQISMTSIWRLRYRFYALIVVLILPIILYSGDSNVKESVSIDPGYKIAEAYLYGSKIVREEEKNKFIQKLVETDIPKKNSAKQKETPIGNIVWVEEGSLKAFDTNLKDISADFALSPLFKIFIQGTNNNNIPRINLNEILPKPERGVKYSWLNFPKYKVQSPIQWSDFNDLFKKNNAGGFDFGAPVDQGPTDAPVQKKLINGIVHIGYTVQPGEIGNSYIVGHSSNFSWVKSEYNTVFKPLESATKVGDEFFIYDQAGRELKFCVFDAVKIADEDLKTAYKEFPGERVVTLQTSILGWRNGTIEATHRWLTRGKLCNDNLKPSIQFDQAQTGDKP
jgi:Sortase domain